MGFGEGQAARPAQPFGADEDSYGDIWEQVEGPASEDDEDGEAFTEFAANPAALARATSLRRRRQPPTPVFDVDGPAEEPEEPSFDADPGHEGTADDVRSLLDKVMEEALPTSPQYDLQSEPAFPEDSTPTLPPEADALAFGEEGLPTLPPAPTPEEIPEPLPARRVPREKDVATMVVDAERAAMDYAVGARERPDSFDAVPAALSDEIKRADRVVRGQPESGLNHLTDDLDLDLASTSPSSAPTPTPLGRRTSVPSDPLPEFPAPAPRPRSLAEPVAATADPVAEPALELAYDPRRSPTPTERPMIDHDRLLDEVTPKGNPNLLIGLAVALIALMLVLIGKSLL